MGISETMSYSIAPLPSHPNTDGMRTRAKSPILPPAPSNGTADSGRHGDSGKISHFTPPPPNDVQKSMGKEPLCPGCTNLVANRALSGCTADLFNRPNHVVLPVYRPLGKTKPMLDDVPFPDRPWARMFPSCTETCTRDFPSINGASLPPPPKK